MSPHASPGLELTHLLVGSRDIDVQVEFYVALLGLSVVTGPQASGALVDGADRELARYMPSTLLTAVETGWVPVFGVPRLHFAETQARLSLIPETVVSPALVREPLGACFGLRDAARPTGTAGGSLVHCELATTDPDRTAAFLERVLAVSFRSIPDDSFDYRAMVDGAGRWLGGLIDQNEFYGSRTASYWTPYFPAADVERQALRAIELGARMHIPPSDSPFDRYAVMSDPLGARFGLSNVDRGRMGAVTQAGSATSLTASQK